MGKLAHPEVGDVNEVGAVPKPRAARLTCCLSPYMDPTNALLRLSSMPRTMASKWVRSVAAGEKTRLTLQLSYRTASKLAIIRNTV